MGLTQPLNGAVFQNPLALAFAADPFKDQTDLVMMAVKQNGLALKFASERLRADKAVVAEALKNNSEARTFISSALAAEDPELSSESPISAPTARNEEEEDGFFCVVQ